MRYHQGHVTVPTDALHPTPDSIVGWRRIREEAERLALDGYITARVVADEQITTHQGEQVQRLELEWTGLDTSGHFAEFHGAYVRASDVCPTERLDCYCGGVITATYDPDVIGRQAVVAADCTGCDQPHHLRELVRGLDY